MKRTLAGLLVGAALGSSGCVTYQYFGEIDARTSDGRDVKALAHWQRTERVLWFDTTSGAVRVQTQCSLTTLVYAERAEGIVLERTPELEPAPDFALRGGHCGRVLDAERIAELGTGELRVQVRCVAASDELSAHAERRAFIAPRDEPWVFRIRREARDQAPAVSACMER